MFTELKAEELFDLDGGGPIIRALGFAYDAHMDFWEGVGEAIYDFYH